MSTIPLLATIASLLADPACARPADDGDAVAGVAPRVVAAPADETEVAALLTHADRERLKVLVRCGGTQLDLGYPPAGGDLLLSLARLNQVVEHAPHDLTVTVQAGMPLAALQATLASAGQWLALDPALPDGATVGGLIATNASGPRRLRYGGVRDQLIGVRVVLVDGSVVKGGGKVVKNVAGYDLPKLFTGALGTLGVVVAATFRLYPLPAASRTVTLAPPDPTPLFALAQQIAASTLEPTILDITGSAIGDCTLAARFETVTAAAEQQAARLVELAAPLGAARILADDEEAAFWRDRATAQGVAGVTADTLFIKASLPPASVAPWLTQLRAAAQERDLGLRWRAHAGHGITVARLTGATDTLLAIIEPLRQATLERRGSLTVLAAPSALADQFDPWGPSPALDPMRRLKAQFDPNATLNPGRFIGRI